MGGPGSGPRPGQKNRAGTGKSGGSFHTKKIRTTVKAKKLGTNKLSTFRHISPSGKTRIALVGSKISKRIGRTAYKSRHNYSAYKSGRGR